ncbi:MAG: hemerythrin domain-containing protein [Arcobacteraceae bacterium]|nr:hemerythrin domain-containing protein [Arcobacteraceae bacterium]
MFETMNWNDDYKIGHEKVDAEHKNLFSIANEILTVGDDINQIKDLIKKLLIYTKTHFINEQNYMKSINYYDLDKHISFHKQILKNLDNFIAKLPTLTPIQIHEELLDFVMVNIVNHIIIEDKKVHHFRRTRDELKAIFRWKEIYSINQEQIDKEHKQLFEIAIEAVNYKGPDVKQHAKAQVVELYNYMKVHFKNEEEYMQTIDYPFYELHLKLHDSIIEQMNYFVKEIPTLSSEIFERKLIEYIDIWLVNHIIHEDQKIADWTHVMIGD